MTLRIMPLLTEVQPPSKTTARAWVSLVSLGSANRVKNNSRSPISAQNNRNTLLDEAK